MTGLVLSSPGRVLFSVNGFEVYVYGLLMAIAILCGVMVSNWLANKSDKFPNDTFVSLAPLLVFCGFVGARLWFCGLDYQHYITSPLEFFNFRSGGISIHGAIFAGMVAMIYYAKKKKMDIISLFAYAAPGVALGQSIGRWGNFFNNEAFGLPFDGFLKLYVPQAYRPQEFLGAEYFHPTFLYESVADFVLFLLLFVALKKSVEPKYVVLTYFLVYSFVRFFIELMRVDATKFVFGLPFPAFVSLGIFLVALVWLCVARVWASRG